ncbi:MAG: hypothetical protein HY791_39345 [Deltaproteobacteria bacterium]|nr:hypothetical protein [Deltaproteobacteria bacterium]
MVPPQAGQVDKAQTQKADFASQVQKAQGAQQSQQAQQAQQSARPQLTGQVRDLAKKLASGKLTEREATKEFVSLVIDDRFPNMKRRKKKKKKDDEEDDESPEEKLEEAVTELIERDPALAKRLKGQFKKLAKG